MHRDSDAHPATSARTSPVPRWLDALVIVSLGTLTLLVLLLVFSYVMAGPGDNLAGVAGLAAVVLMVPLSVAFGLALAGVCLRRRHPRAALALAASSAGLAGLIVLLVPLSYVQV